MELRLLAFACLLGAALAGPVQRETGSQCSTRCVSRPNEKFSYEIGKKYVYQYSGENVISIAGQRKQKASIEGVAEIHVVDRCEMVLQLRNLRLQQKLSQPEIQELAQQLQIPVSFSFEDGQVQNVCPSHEESPHSLNIKKGIISTLINTMTKLDQPQEVKETDSLGRCLTNYTVKYEQGLEIQKEKSLKSCTNRHSSVTSLITNPYESPDSLVNTLPIFPEEHLVCKQQVENKIIKSVQCIEQATVQPLKSHESIIQFEGKVELKLLSKDRAERLQMPQSKAPEPILYNLQDEQRSESKEAEVQEILRDMCSQNTGAVDITVSKKFIKLVNLVKTVPLQTLQRIHRDLKNGNICTSKKVLDIFLDTLPMAGSDASVQLMVELLEREEVTGLKAKVWPASLALIPHPSEKAVEAVIPLLRGKITPPVLLGVSAMINRFCVFRNCESVPSVQQIISILNEKLGRSCSNEDESEIFAVLKAFGNMGHIGSAEQNILACASDNDKATRLRLAAIDAFRRTNTERPEGLLRLYQDVSENFEIRIAALASIMKKANKQQLQAIKVIVENEENEQVNAYASTLINNMRKTSSPLKKSVRTLLEDIVVKTPKSSYWDNSKNIEVSAFSEMLNLGGSIETDLIHAQDSKIPRSLYTRFDVDVFSKNINLFELGLRAEGLEEIFKKLIGLKDEIKKQSSLPSWKLLSSNNLFSESNAEASLFIRTMNTEIFDVSASDLTGMSEMIKIADVMKKMAEGRNADFSHSFLFLNSQLVIPSVTGRSYSFGVTGSATVGLTARTKADFMSFPRNTDVEAHFQPSANVEISTTVGIQSNKYRPDVKLVSRLHLESDMQALFKIKDSHVALVSVIMPSENVLQAKISSDVIEIDAHHQEKRVFERMQQKIDYCFNKLEKPLGLSVCGKWEVPRPFITKTFPFVQGVGNLEFSIKKTDDSLKAFEFRVEIPKHASQIMKYQASLDTPGTRISRRFAAELEVREQARGKKQFSMELTSPFKSAGGSGVITKRQDWLEGSLELHSGLSNLVSCNATAQIVESRSRKLIKPSIEISLLNRKPLRIGGSLSFAGGRKQEIAIDIQANHPVRKPFTVKGTIMKDGSFELTREAEWKLSSDLALESPVGDAKLRGHVEKQFRQAEFVSTRLSLEYQKQQSQVHTMKFSGTSQKSSSKMSTNAQFDSTQFPSANWNVNWDMQGDIRQNLKNDITIKYGLNPEASYINIKHKSRIPQSGAGDCKIYVKAPHLNVDSEITINHELTLGETPKIMVETDVVLNKDKHYYALYKLHCESVLPLKAYYQAEVQYPGAKYTYRDEIEEISRHKYQGRSQVQWGMKEKQQAELKYLYAKNEAREQINHELESSLSSPMFDAPIKSKASLGFSARSLTVEGRVNLARNAEYSIKADLKQEGTSHIVVKSPQVEGNMKSSNEVRKNSLDLDLSLKSRRPRRITASVIAQREGKQQYEMEVQWDADQQPQKKFYLSTEYEKSGKSYESKAKLQVTNIATIEISEAGEMSLWGRHEGQLEASIKNKEPISIQYQHQLSREEMKTTITYSKNRMQKARIDLEGDLRKDRSGHKYAAKVALKCLDSSFQDKEFAIHHQMSKSGSSKSVETTLRVQRSPRQVYQAEWKSQSQPQGIEIKAQLETPHSRYEKQAVSVSCQRSKTGVLASVRVEMPQRKEISVSCQLQTKSDGLTTTWVVKSPFECARDLKFFLQVENQRKEKSVLSYMDVNNERLSDVKARVQTSQQKTELDAEVKVSPIRNIPLQGLQISYKKSKQQAYLSGKLELENNKEIELSTELKKQSQSVTATASLRSSFTKMQDAKVHLAIEYPSSKKSLLFYVDKNSERKADMEWSLVPSSRGMEMQARVKTAWNPELSARVQMESSQKFCSLSAKVLKGSNPLMKFEHPSEKQQRSSARRNLDSEKLIDTLLDLQITSDRSREQQQHSLKASGPFSPLSLSVSTSRKEKGAQVIEASACRSHQKDEEKQTCYTLRGTHKSVEQDQTYTHYKKIVVELEKQTPEQRQPVPISNIHMILSAGQKTYRSKILIVHKSQNYGYEAKLHQRQHENDDYSVEFQVFRPSAVSQLKASMKVNPQQSQLHVQFSPRVSDSRKMYELEAKLEKPSQDKLSASMRMSKPRMQKPITMIARLQTQKGFPVEGKIELEFSPESGKVLTLEISREQERRSALKSITYRLFREDKSLDASFKIAKEQTKQEDIYGYEWSIKSSRIQEKKGGASLKIAEMRNGRPQKIEISYFSPNCDYKVHATHNHQANAPTHASINVQSSGRKIKEIKIRTSESCLELEVTQQGPMFESSICFNKKQPQKTELISLMAEYHRQKAMELSVSFNPEAPTHLDVVMEWKNKEMKQALLEASGIKRLLEDDTVRELRQLIREQYRKLKFEIIKPQLKKLEKQARQLKETASRKITKVMQEKKQQLKKQFEEQIRIIRDWKDEVEQFIRSTIPFEYLKDEVFMPLWNSVQCFWSSYYNVVSEHIPEVLHLFWEVSKQKFVECMKKFCVEGTFCHQFLETVERYGVQEACKLLKKKASQTKQKLHMQIAESVPFPDVQSWFWKMFDYYKYMVEKAYEKFYEFFFGNKYVSSFVDYYKDWAREWRMKIIDAYEEFLAKFREIIRKAERDEDFKTAKNLVKETQKKIQKAWTRREQVVKNAWPPVKESLKTRGQQMLQTRVDVMEYSPEEGLLKLKLKQPFKPNTMKVISNSLEAVKQKLQQSLAL